MRCQRVPAWTQVSLEAPLCVRLDCGNVAPCRRAHVDGGLVRISRANTSFGESVVTGPQDRLATNTGHLNAAETSGSGRLCDGQRLGKGQGSYQGRDSNDGKELDFHGDCLFSLI